MVDITKDEFWDSKYEEISKKEENKIKGFISKNKVIIILLVSFGILMVINTVLIYNFFKILETIR